MSEFDAFAKELATEEADRKRQLAEATSLGAATTFEPAPGALPEMPKVEARSEFSDFAEDIAREENVQRHRTAARDPCSDDGRGREDRAATKPSGAVIDTFTV